VKGSDHGLEAMTKARDVIEQARAALRAPDDHQTSEIQEALKRTLKMFKAVIT
jgi:F0F1-type ATP synthase membrane subunit b/b'